MAGLVQGTEEGHGQIALVDPGGDAVIVGLALEPASVEGRLEPVLEEGGVQCLDALLAAAEECFLLAAGEILDLAGGRRCGGSTRGRGAIVTGRTTKRPLA